MKKKILFMIDSLNCGGAEKSLVSLLSLLDYDKYDVDLQLYKPEGMFVKLLPKEVNILPNLEFYDFCRLSFVDQIKTFNISYMISKLRLSFGSRFNGKKVHGAQIFWRNCKNSFEKLDNNYDVAIAYNQGFPTYFVAEKVNATKKFAWVNTDYIKAGYNPYIDREYYQKFDGIVGVSEEAKEVLSQCFSEFNQKLYVIKDINNAELIEKMADEEVVFDDIDDRIIKIVTVGRLVQSKGYDLALGAAKILNEKGINFKWYVLGEGVERQNIEKFIEENKLQDKFILLGEKSNPYPYMKNCDIYAQTSRFEGFGLAIAEAKILNKVVITTDFDTAYNQIENGINGFIVDMNENSISSIITSLINNEHIKKYIVGHLKIEEKGNEKEIQKFYELIES